MRGVRDSLPTFGRRTGSIDSRLACALLLFGLWSAPILLVGIAGDFPLNDDFAYARATFGWLRTGEFQRLPWTYVPLYTHAAFGAAAAFVFGQSFEALRLVGLLGFGLSIAGTFALARTLKADAVWAVVAAAVVATNPLVVNLAFTFMTDVPFTAMVVWSLVFTLRGLEQRRNTWLLVGLGLATAALLSRQSGLALWIGSAGAFAVRASPRMRIASAVIGVGAVVALAGVGVDGFRVGFLAEKLSRVGGVVFAVVTGLATGATYLGWFTLPLVWPAWRFGPRGPMALGAAASLLFGFAGIEWLDRGHPPGINMIYDLGIGPIVLHGAERLAALPEEGWIALSALGLAAAGVNAVFLLHGAASQWREEGRGGAWLVLASFVLLFLGVHVIRVPFFDRHLVPLLPAVAAVLVSLIPPGPASRPAVPTLAVLAVMAAVGWAGLHDYLAHQRTRNAVIADLLAAGATPATLDAGFEYQGWANYHPGTGKYLDNNREWVTADDYLVTLAPDRTGYAVVSERSYRRWLPIQVQTVYGQRRVDDGSNR